MRWWKIFRSNKEGQKPTVNNLPLDAIGVNHVDGILFIKKRAAGVESIVEIGGSGTGPSVVGIPPGGTTGQPLKKKSNADYDVDWEDEAGGDSLQLNPETITFNGLTVILMAGESLAKGNICYMTGSKMYKGDADAFATSLCFGIATDNIIADGTGVFLLIGMIEGFTSLAVGSPVYLSTTAGALTQTLVSGSNDVVQIVGIAISATHIYFKPELATVELL